MTLPLEGLKIIDLSRLLPGPFATMMLADLGAEVIKVEEPGRGDYARQYRVKLGNVGANFAVLNRNKKSITLNLKHPQGPDILKKLILNADILVESYRPGVMDRLGVGYKILSEINPRLIYCAITGFGQTGPYRDRPGHDLNYLGYTGVASLTGKRGGAPLPPGVQVADIGGGSLTAAFSILAAVIAREKTDRGQFIDISMSEGALAWLTTHFASLASKAEPVRAGEMRLNGGQINYNIYETRDGRHVTLGALEEKFWNNFCAKIERPDLLDKVYVTGAERDMLEVELQNIFQRRDIDEWLKLLEDEDICFGPVYNIEEAVMDSHLRARKVFMDVPLPGGGTVLNVAHPVVYSETPAIGRGSERPLTAAPELGQHNETILGAIGCDVDALKREGVV